MGEPSGCLNAVKLGAMILAGAVCLSAPVVAADPNESGTTTPVPTAESVDTSAASLIADEALEGAGARIGEIVVRARPIFDTESGDEDTRLFRFANRLHWRTRDRTIRRRLLFAPGDAFSRSKLQESERALREARYLYDAAIEVLRYEDDVVDVSVETRDVWTLGGGVSFGRSGGTNTSRIGLEEKNLFGMGKELQFKRTTNVDRSSSRLRYRDDNLLGGRSRLVLAYSSNSDGYLQQVGLERPFVSLDSHWSAGVRWNAYDRTDSHYSLGKISDQFRHMNSSAEVYGGLSRGLMEGRTVRYSAGVTLADDRFEPTSFRSDRPIPTDRTLAYPWLEYSLVEDGFIKQSDLDRIERTEDFNLGKELRVRVGYAAATLGSDRDQAVVESSFSSGYLPGPGQLLFVTAGLDGRVGAGREENLVLHAGVRYLFRDWRRHVLALSLSGDIASNLDAENQLTLGGDNGLRGYPLRYQDGDRRVLLSVEQRFYTDWHLLKLFRVGAAVFADAGQAWFRQDTPAVDGRSNLLRDVGFGLRLASSRSSHGSMIRFDVAVPLDGDPSISRTQFLVSTGERF